jgi:glutathione-specific gamma-glutamylcyclotransferase
VPARVSAMKLMPGDPSIDPNDFWIFGYASLMWRPGFAFTEAQAATLPGFVRDMCFTSIHYRGTPEVPGLVCGLMPLKTGLCKGYAYRVALDQIDTAVNYLDSRELITGIYLPRHLPLQLADGRRITARVHVADTKHAQFSGTWSDAEKVAAIVKGVGSEGRSLDYLSSLVDRLHELEIEDAHMMALLEKAYAM